MDRIEQLQLIDARGGCRLAVKVVPNARGDRVAGVLGNALKVAVAAPAEQGKANKAVAKLLGKLLGVPARQVELVSGPASPQKEFRILGRSAETVRQMLAKA